MLRSVAFASVLAASCGAAAAADLPPPIAVAPPGLTSPTPAAFNWSGFYLGAHAGYGFGKGAFADGAAAGGQVGVNRQYDAFVVGAEGDGSWADWQGADAVGTARLRGGLAAGRFLVYATGGAAFASFSDVGWVAGGGLEYALARNWVFGAEYLYYDVGGGTSDVFRGRVSYLYGIAAGTPPMMLSSTPVAFNWSGFYIGAHGGYSFPSGGGAVDSYEIGGQVGVNRQVANAVFGIEFEGGFVDWGPVAGIGSIRARGGLAWDRFLFYAAGGLGIEDALGWTLGGGVEYALTDRWSAGVEYLHGDYQSGRTVEVVRGRVNYLFDHTNGV